jgi:hypothetical protein
MQPEGKMKTPTMREDGFVIMKVNPSSRLRIQPLVAHLGLEG